MSDQIDFQTLSPEQLVEILS